MTGNTVFIGLQNRRINPQIFYTDHTDTTKKYLKFLSTAEFEVLCDSGGVDPEFPGSFLPASHWRSYYYKSLGSREITIPFNYCDSTNPNMKQGVLGYETEDPNVSSKSSIEYIKANPVISNSELRYIIMEECEVILDIRDERGLLVTNLVSSFHKPGTYDIKIDAKDMISGTYFATLKACDQVVTLKFVVIK